jgi:drug/metabolite transporter (DMT)-like permease
MRPGGETAQLASLLSVGCAACYAVYQILTRRVTATDSPETAAGYSALVGTALLSVVVPFAWTPPATSWTLVMLASMGVTGGLGHYFVARAYVWAPASVVSPFNYLQLLGAAATGYLIFGDLPGPGLWAGAALIVGSGLFIAWVESRPTPALPLVDR